MKEEKTLYIVDNIILYKPAIESKNMVKWDELQKTNTEKRVLSRISFHKVIFCTYDINSMFDRYKKMRKLLKLAFPYPAYIKDDFGRVKKITPAYLLCNMLGYIMDHITEKHLMNQLEQEIEQLTVRKESNKKVLNLKKRAIHIKATLSYGVQSGGMVSHASGVIQGMMQLHCKPVVFTTDCLKNSLKDIPRCYIPLHRYQNSFHAACIYMNSYGYEMINQQLGNRQFSFLYERSTLFGLIGVKLARERQIPFVLEVNDIATWTARVWGGDKSDLKLIDHCETIKFKEADLITCVSGEMKELLLQRGISDSKILVNYNGVNTDEFHPEVENTAVKNQYGLEHKIVIGWIGSFYYFHGVEELAKAFVKLNKKYPEYKSQVSLLLIGEGPLKDSVKQIIRRNKLEEQVILTGAIAPEKAPSYLSSCDILVASHIPNKDNSPFFGSPTKIFEYMAMGKGIIASRLNQLGEILEDGKTAKMVLPGDIEELTKAMKELIDDRVLRETLGQNARKVVQEKYTWKMHVQKIMIKLSEICEVK